MLKDSEVAYLNFDSAKTVRSSLRKKKPSYCCKISLGSLPSILTPHTMLQLQYILPDTWKPSRPPEYMYHAHTMPLDLGPIAKPMGNPDLLTGFSLFNKKCQQQTSNVLVEFLQIAVHKSQSLTVTMGLSH